MLLIGCLFWTVSQFKRGGERVKSYDTCAVKQCYLEGEEMHMAKLRFPSCRVTGNNNLRLTVYSIKKNEAYSACKSKSLPGILTSFNSVMLKCAFAFFWWSQEQKLCHSAVNPFSSDHVVLGQNQVKCLAEALGHFAVVMQPNWSQSNNQLYFLCFLLQALDSTEWPLETIWYHSVIMLCTAHLRVFMNVDFCD